MWIESAWCSVRQWGSGPGARTKCTRAEVSIPWRGVRRKGPGLGRGRTSIAEAGIADCRVVQLRQANTSASWALMSGAFSMPTMGGSEVCAGSRRMRLIKSRDNMRGELMRTECKCYVQLAFQLLVQTSHECLHVCSQSTPSSSDCANTETSITATIPEVYRRHQQQCPPAAGGFITHAVVQAAGGGGPKQATRLGLGP